MSQFDLYKICNLISQFHEVYKDALCNETNNLLRKFPALYKNDTVLTAYEFDAAYNMGGEL